MRSATGRKKSEVIEQQIDQIVTNLSTTELSYSHSLGGNRENRNFSPLDLLSLLWVCCGVRGGADLVPAGEKGHQRLQKEIPSQTSKLFHFVASGRV